VPLGASAWYADRKPLSTIHTHTQPDGTTIATTERGSRVLRTISYAFTIRHRSNKNPSAGFIEEPGPCARTALEGWLVLERLDAR
jgi:hypothetical protein